MSEAIGMDFLVQLPDTTLEDEGKITGNKDEIKVESTKTNETDTVEAQEYAQKAYADSSLTRSERVDVIRDLFHERCSLLYHDIIDTIRHGDHEDTSSEASSPRLPKDDLWCRHRRLVDEAELVTDKVPEMTEDVRYRMQLVQSGMSQLESATSKHHDSSASSGDENGCSGSLAQLRRWLQSTEDKLCCVGWQNFHHTSLPELQNMHSQQQVLQREIEHDGGALVSAVQRQLKVRQEDLLRSSERGVGGRVGNRRRVVIESLQRRWHSLWLRSLEWQYKFEEQIRLIQLGLIQGEESDSDSNEPSAKRRRLGQHNFDLQIPDSDTRSETSDTIPFAASEYESIMEAIAEASDDHNGNHLNPDMGSLTPDSDVEYRNEKGQVVHNRGAMVGDNQGVMTLKEEGDWLPGRVEIVHQDVGYSSGENSLHEGINDEQLVKVFEPQGGGRVAFKRVRGGAVIPRSPSDQLNNNVQEEPPLLDNTLEEQVPTAEDGNLQTEGAENPTDSVTSSPGIERRKRIENSPIKSYYKMTPLDDGGQTDTETPRPSQTEEDSLMMMMIHGKNPDEGFLPEGMESSLIVQVDSEVSGQKDLQEVLSLLDDSFEKNIPMSENLLGEQIEKIEKEGTTWRPFTGRKIGLEDKAEEGEALKTEEEEEEEGDVSCDASGEQSEGEDQSDLRVASPPELIISPPPPNSPQEFQMTSTPTGSLKRQRRRPRSERPLSLTNGLRPWQMPNSNSETAIMNMSMCSSTVSNFDTSSAKMDYSGSLMTQSLNSTLPRNRGGQARRKKLKARRMPRSLSDGEHLSFFARNRNSGKSSEVVDPPPPSPTENDGFFETEIVDGDQRDDENLPDVEDSRRRDGGGIGCSFEEMGGGEGLVERLDGDGGSVSETAEQSEANVWEWDDYKPPDHSELGPPDQKLDDSKLTAFGDDYRLYLGSMDNQSDLSSSARSTRLPSAHLTEPGLRVPPVGLSSHDSDSEVEDLYHVIKESQKQLRVAQAAVRRGVEHSGSGRNNGHNMAELFATCETNVRCLQTITGHMLSLGAKSVYTQNDYNTVTGLLKDWQDLLFSVRKFSAGNSSCSNSNLASNGNSVDATGCLLESEIRRLASTLQDLIDQGSLNTSFTTGCYKSQNELQESIELLQDLHSKLQEERHRLRLLAKSCRSVSGADPEIKGELQQLCQICERALETCAHQLSEMGHLRQSWEDCEQNVDTLTGALETLEKKVGQLEFHKENVGRVATSGPGHLPNVKEVFSDLQLCQERLNRLETVCNFLVSSCQQQAASLSPNSDQNAQVPTAESSVPEFTKHLESLNEKLEELQTRFRDLPNVDEICKCHEKESQKRRRSATKAKRREKAEKTVRNAKNKGQKLRAKGMLGSVWGMVKSSWPIQLCLLVLVCLGAAVIQPLCCQERNNWEWAWGPQLNYVRGPPPS